MKILTLFLLILVLNQESSPRLNGKYKAEFKKIFVNNSVITAKTDFTLTFEDSTYVKEFSDGSSMKGIVKHVRPGKKAKFYLRSYYTQSLKVFEKEYMILADDKRDTIPFQVFRDSGKKIIAAGILIKL